MEPLKEYRLKNGLLLRLYDKTYRYFGEYFFIEIEAVCEVPADFVNKDNIPLDLKSLYPEKVIFKKTLSKKGVYETDLDKEKRILIEYFEKNGLPYIQSKNFPDRLFQKELQNIKKKKDIEELRRKLSEGEDSTLFQ